MKIPDNFVLLLFAAVLVAIGWLVPATSAASQMLAQLWAIVLVLIKSDQPILPTGQVPAKPSATIQN